jgi:hypothetical protein
VLVVTAGYLIIPKNLTPFFLTRYKLGRGTAEFWHPPCLIPGMALRITVEENKEAIVVKLEGRIVGPWAAELDRLWEKTLPTLASRRLSLDLRETTYADARGIRTLRTIYSQTQAAILTSTPWTQYLAEEVMGKNPNQAEAQDAR